MKNNNKWFTLIEVLVAITILSIIMVSVFTTFILAWDVNNRVEASRVMQENIKHFVEVIWEDIRKNDIIWVQDDNSISNCDLSFSGNNYKKWSKLCIWDNQYYLAEYIDSTDTWARKDYCDIDTNCSIVLKDTLWKISPITNSWISFQNLSFTVSDTNPRRVQINFEARPAIWKWIKPNLIERNIIKFQTTISKRIYEEYR